MRIRRLHGRRIERQVLCWVTVVELEPAVEHRDDGPGTFRDRPRRRRLDTRPLERNGVSDEARLVVGIDVVYTRIVRHALADVVRAGEGEAADHVVVDVGDLHAVVTSHLGSYLVRIQTLSQVDDEAPLDTPALLSSFADQAFGFVAGCRVDAAAGAA